MRSATLLLSLLLLVAVALVQGISISNKTPAEAQVVNPDANKGFTVQSGYEGYLVSPQKAQGPSGTALSTLLSPVKLGILKSMIVPAASFLIVYGVKFLGVAVHLVLALVLGAVATTAVCSFTPLCSISLNTPGLGFLKGPMVREQVAEIARTFMTPENMEIVTKLVQTSLDKYGHQQRREPEQPVEQYAKENTTT